MIGYSDVICNVIFHKPHDILLVADKTARAYKIKYVIKVYAVHECVYKPPRQFIFRDKRYLVACLITAQEDSLFMCVFRIKIQVFTRIYMRLEIHSMPESAVIYGIRKSNPRIVK